MFTTHRLGVPLVVPKPALLDSKIEWLAAILHMHEHISRTKYGSGIDSDYSTALHRIYIHWHFHWQQSRLTTNLTFLQISLFIKFVLFLNT